MNQGQGRAHGGMRPAAGAIEQPRQPAEAAAALVPRMSEEEVLLLRAAMRGKRTVIEWGSGGSTPLILECGAERLVSIESDPAWVARLADHPDLRSPVADGRLDLVHVDVGPTGAWGKPTDRSRVDDWPRYWETPWERVDREQVEAVLVDGRFRVACALQAVRRCRPGTTIVFHDFWDRRWYWDVLPFLVPVCRADTLAVFVPREDLGRKKLKRAIEAFREDVR